MPLTHVLLLRPRRYASNYAYGQPQQNVIYQTAPVGYQPGYQPGYNQQGYNQGYQQPPPQSGGVGIGGMLAAGVVGALVADSFFGGD